MSKKQVKDKGVKAKKEVEKLIPQTILDTLERIGKPYVVIMKDTDSVLAKKAAKAKIDYRTNIEGSAFINLLQTVISGVLQQANQQAAMQRRR